MFRVFQPTNVPYGFCPRLERIKEGKLTDSRTSYKSPEAWETVPTVARDLNFAFVVRDRKIRSGEAGNVAVDKVLIKVFDVTPFSLTSFNMATIVNQRSKHTVTWEVGGTANPEINTKTVTIKLAADGKNFNDIY